MLGAGTPLGKSSPFIQKKFSVVRPGTLRGNPQFVPHGGKGRNGGFQILTRMRGGDLGADPGLSMGNHGITETDDINPMVQHRVGKPGRQGRVTQHNGADRVRSRQHILPHVLKTLTEEPRVFLQPVTQFG